MFATQSFRGEQYQTALMLLNTLLRWARTKGLKEIYLGTTPKFIAAHRFYGKNGFVEISKDLLPNTFPIMKVDTKFYKFEL
jgi:GNAT superfamily N-acetyltransferase